MRVILFLILAIAVLYLARRWFRRLLEQTMLDLQKKSTQTPNAAPAQALVACAKCQVMVPSLDAVYRNNKPYCSQAHSD